MKTSSHCIAESCLETSQSVQTVQIEVALDHPLLLLKRALRWDAITEVMTRHWREYGKNVDGGPGLPWDVSLYVPLVVLMRIKSFDSRQMAASLAENVVARVFLGRHHDDAVNHLVVKEAHRFGFVDEGILSADTTAQE